MTHQDLRRKVEHAYSVVARNPRGPHPFPAGREFARSLGYPAELLDKTPAASLISPGCGNPAGHDVADVGCGAGLDTFIAAASAGRVIAIDFSQAMLEPAQAGAAAESLPIATAELARVLRPGGAVYAAELILTRPLPTEIRQRETDWFA